MDLPLPLPLRARRSPALALRNAVSARAAVGALLVLALLGGGWLWLRDSSLVAVQRVRISGARGVQGPQIEAALSAAARRMTTMDFDAGALRSAVASFPVVKDLRVTTSFPHEVRIRVTERPPVAALLGSGERTAVAADGTVLGPALLSSSLPSVSGPLAPPPGTRVSDANVLAGVAVLGAAPAPLARFVARAFSGPEGLTVAMSNGLLVYFGDAARPHAKWLSLARVLADPGSAGAWYVDVRVPERPAAGRSGSSSAVPVQAGASDPTAAALAERLASAVGGGSAGPGESSSQAASEGSAASEASPSGGREAPSEASSQPAPGG